jgi:signal transduction histidine kinase
LPRVSRLKSGVGAADDIARIAVRDFGIGISPADQHRIFGRFERAVSQRHDVGLGLGFGSRARSWKRTAARSASNVRRGAGTRLIVELPL